MFLLDTNVVSETRKRAPDGTVLAWLEAQDQSELFMSVLSVGEITKGIARLAITNPAAAVALNHWLAGIEDLFADRLIPIDTEIATAWGGLNAARPLPVIDSLLAATAITRDLTLVTRNVKDVLSTGVQILNPWNASI